MKRILCFGDSNTHGTAPMRDENDVVRFDAEKRWPGVLRAALGSGFDIVEEGHPGRTTVHDDPVEGAHKMVARICAPFLKVTGRLIWSSSRLVPMI